MKMEIQRIARDFRRYLRWQRGKRGGAPNPMTDEILERLDRAQRNAWKSLPNKQKRLLGLLPKLTA